MLNLQETSRRSAGIMSSGDSQIQSIVFKRIVGSLGEFVYFDDGPEVDGVAAGEEPADRGVSKAGVETEMRLPESDGSICEVSREA